MKIKLLDIPTFIKKNNVKEIKSVKTEGRAGKPDSEGLFSEEIFGRIGSNQRKQTYGYIDLGVKIIHPQAWDIVTGINPAFNKLILTKKKYSIGVDGDLIEDPGGKTGLYFLISNFDKLNLSLLGKFKPENVKFIKKNKDLLFIDKLLVLPAGIRDIQFSKTTGKKMIQFSEINALYQELITQTKTIPLNSVMLPEEILNSINTSIQRKAIEISEWILQRMKGKGGLLRVRLEN
jgi:hypothetical protein